jgi:hypothetical protein
MGAANDIEAWLQDPKSVDQYEKHQAQLGENPSEETLLNTRLVPDPRKVKLRVYHTNSIHKSMSALRQGSILLVKDVEFHTVEAQSARRCSPMRPPVRTSSSSPASMSRGARWSWKAMDWCTTRSKSHWRSARRSPTTR